MTSRASAVALTFHGLSTRPEKTAQIKDPAAARYAVSEELFRRVLDQISPELCCTVSEFIHKSDGRRLILTFDDGLISDFSIAFPALVGRGLKANFFITAGNVGKRGYLTYEHLSQMADQGMEIGSHGLTHRYLITMRRSEALREIRESKAKLEQEIGYEVRSFAPVGGHFRQWMKEEAEAAGYRAFATMVPGRTLGCKDFIQLKRNHILAGHDSNYINAVVNGSARLLFLNRFKYEILRLTRAVLGMKKYDRLKGLILDYC